ncbi:lipoprotein-releasing ABC transporter permease subunit [Rheinheimera sp. MMS21-TC3]|uniref:lipoprotein-releasing ABC transporter permease subunit n=1 Tax=Rheinheimera sp. MMS21-TC3 TaxID=3072790 RepID=UPI0028C3E2DE|nr:lipoprotein-releasing ABC transporter permease subunit [Rheinheimera sp. MMS21-TC3]WNO61201.1 lipoprotein-releasing ABC transporter permease subunit [Rheinheimera sp. MMS21-TC3]
MLKLAWQFAKRYRSNTQSSGFIRFISASSTLGITLGVAILIVALSVMNGFEQVLKQRLLSVIPHVELEAVSEGLTDWQAKISYFNTIKGVAAGAPYIKTQGMLRQGQTVKAAEVRGIALDYEQRISDFANYVVAGQLTTLTATDIVLGKGIAEALQVQVGDSVQLLLPTLADDGRLASYNNVGLTVTAIVSVGGQLDYSQAWLDIAALAQLLHYPEARVQGFAFRLNDIFSAPEMAVELGRHSTDYVYLLDWFRSQGHVYQDIQMVRTILYLVLALVIAVACFNIVATLVMAVREKQSDIAILLTMGMPKRSIIVIFVCLGWLNGLIGTVLGAIIGVLLAVNIEPIFAAISKVLGHAILDPSIYFVNFIPSVLHLNDVVITCLVALMMSLIATLYPAMRASKVQPAAVLGQK